MKIALIPAGIYYNDGYPEALVAFSRNCLKCRGISKEELNLKAKNRKVRKAFTQRSQRIEKQTIIFASSA
jgi:hypothetical protein